MIGCLSDEFNKKKRLYKIFLSRLFVAFKISIIWKARYKYFGNSLEAIYLNRVRYTISFKSILAYKNFY